MVKKKRSPDIFQAISFTCLNKKTKPKGTATYMVQLQKHVTTQDELETEHNKKKDS